MMYIQRKYKAHRVVSTPTLPVPQEQPPANPPANPRPAPNTKEFAQEKPEEASQRLKIALKTKREAEMTINREKEKVLLWRTRVTEWEALPTIDEEFEAILQPKETNREE
ncbi:hypothetical protein GGS20DRAFT_584176 [Poronia punctata]|nr:hypothetical protein GGS20DRAFT_584176 [Poronia punctata]